MVGRLTVRGTGGETWSSSCGGGGGRGAEPAGRAGEQGRTRFDLTPLGSPAVQELRLEATDPRVRWNVDRVLLHTPFEARFRPALADGNLRIWENQEALPRAWWVGQYALAEDGGAALEQLREGGVDPAATAVLTAPVPGMTRGGRVCPLARSAAGPCRRRCRLGDGEHPALRGHRPGGWACWWSPRRPRPGWQATVDGRPAPLYTANGGLQAVRRPGGAAPGGAALPAPERRRWGRASPAPRWPSWLGWALAYGAGGDGAGAAQGTKPSAGGTAAGGG